MKAKDLTIRSLEDMPLLVNIGGEYDVYTIDNFSVETDMRTGETCVILVANEEPMSDNARDFEHHPAYYDFNKWLYAKEETQ